MFFKGDAAYAQRVPWTQAVYLVGTGCSALICQVSTPFFRLNYRLFETILTHHLITICERVLFLQTFLVIRIYRLTSNVILLAAFGPCILAGFAGSIGMAIFLVRTCYIRPTLLTILAGMLSG